jgi:hypothetical protein
MHPALAERIEASLARHAGRPRGGIYPPVLVALARGVVALAVVAAAVALYVAGSRARARLEARRAALVAAVVAESASLRGDDRVTLVRAERALQRLARPWEGDVVSPELRARGGLDAVLAAGVIYAHANLGDLTAEHPLSVAALTRESTKDALLLCLYAPPSARAEQPLVAKVLDAWDAPVIERATAPAVLLRDAEAGLPILAPDWLLRVKVATPTALARLETAHARAPVDAAQRAARARSLLVALDEGAGSLALDGDHAHDVRVAIVDLASGAELLRLRRRVDPSWVAPSRRAKYSIALDGCTLALDVREGAGATAK